MHNNFTLYIYKKSVDILLKVKIIYVLSFLMRNKISLIHRMYIEANLRAFD